MRWTPIAIALALLSPPLSASDAGPKPGWLGTLIPQATFDSPALGGSIEGAVYLASGVGEALGEAAVPVVYLLHGTNSEGMDWVHEAELPQVVDALVSTGRIRPMIVVMPNAGNSWYADSAALGGPGDYRAAILRDLPAGVERRWPARSERGGRALIGISMGGHGALGMAFSQPERYAAAVSLSGAFWNRTDQSQIPADRVARIFAGSFGVPFNRARFLADSPFGQIRRLKDSGLPLAIRLVTGDHERFNTLAQSIDLLTTLRDAGLDAELRVIGGDHDWGNWSQALPEALIFVDRVFRGAQTAPP